jgi:hypothetical protein
MPEIGKLTAVFDVDDSRYGAGVRRVETGTKRAEDAIRSSSKTVGGFSDALKGAATGMGAINGPLEGVSSRLSSLASVTSGLGTETSALAARIGPLLASMGPVGIAAAGIAAQLAVAATAATAFYMVGEKVVSTFFDLAKSAAGFRGELFDSSQQLGISTETLSALEILAKTTGSDLGGLSASLGIFQKHLEEAQNPLSKTGKLLTELGVSTTDTESALRETLTALAAMPEGFTQTSRALELFGRGGKSMLAILKEMHGDLDGAIERFREMGLVVSREDAEAADKFNDQLAILQFQVRALLGKEAIPGATKVLEELSRVLKENRGLLDAFGGALKIAGLAAEGMVLNITRGGEALSSFGAMVARTIPDISLLASIYDRLSNAARSATISMSGATGAAQGVNFQPGLAGGGADASSVHTQHQPGRVVGGGSSKGGGGTDPATTARRMADLNLKIVLDGLKSEEDEIKRSLGRRLISFEEYALRSNVLENDRHRNTVSGLTVEMEAALRLKKSSQQQIAVREVESKVLQENIRHKQALAKTEDEGAKFVDMVNEFIKRQSFEMAEANAQTDRWNAAINELKESLSREGVPLDANIEKTMRFSAMMAVAADDGRKLSEVLANMPDMPELPGIGAMGRVTDEQRARQLSEAIDRAMGGALPPPDLAEYNKRLQDFAGKLTDTIDNALKSGFEKGMKAGLVSFAQGILAMINSWALGQLKNAIYEALKGATGGSGGGWGGLLKAVGIGAAGGAAGGVGGAGSGGAGAGLGALKFFAKGGYLGPGQWGVAGENGPEPIYGGRTGMTVIPNKTAAPNVTINFRPVFNAHPTTGAFSKPSASQVVRGMLDQLEHEIERGGR